MQDRTTRDESFAHRIDPTHDVYPGEEHPLPPYPKQGGVEISAQLRCDGCGEKSAAHMRFCKHCGMRLLGDDAMPGLKSNATPSYHDTCLVCLESNGSDGAKLSLDQEQTDIGRLEGDVVFADDPFLSVRHARFQRRLDDYYVIDLDSVNGVYIRITDPVPLNHGDTVLIGQQVLRLELLPEVQPLGAAFQQGVRVFGTPEVPRPARLVQYTTEGVGRDVYTLYRDETVLGRESGDIVFTDDPFLSRRHAAIVRDRTTGSFSLYDLGSSNGTGLRIRVEHKLQSGDQIRMGRQLFRFESHVSLDAERHA